MPTLKQTLHTLCQEQADIICQDKLERDALAYVLQKNEVRLSQNKNMLNFEDGLVICLYVTNTYSFVRRSDPMYPKTMAKDLLLLADKVEEANYRFTFWPVPMLFIAMAIALIIIYFKWPKAQKPVTYSDEQSFQYVIDSLDSVYWLKNAHSDSNWDASP